MFCLTAREDPEQAVTAASRAHAFSDIIMARCSVMHTKYTCAHVERLRSHIVLVHAMHLHRRESRNQACGVNRHAIQHTFPRRPKPKGPPVGTTENPLAGSHTPRPGVDEPGGFLSAEDISGWVGVDYSDDAADGPEARTLFIFGSGHPVRRVCSFVSGHAVTEVVVLSLVAVNSVMLAIDSPAYPPSNRALLYAGEVVITGAHATRVPQPQAPAPSASARVNYCSSRFALRSAFYNRDRGQNDRAWVHRTPERAFARNRRLARCAWLTRRLQTLSLVHVFCSVV